MPKDVRKLARNPWAILGLAGLGGWLVGSGVFALPFALPSLGGHAAAAAAPASPAALPASSSSTAQLAQTSATMPAPTSAGDPFAGYNL